jgi:16S rRNA A1518/A1519 N6-dimethyltransferase RsmA/KsgA/DIM1 with predicted DNA glycosylase/AP lyase activity
MFYELLVIKSVILFVLLWMFYTRFKGAEYSPTTKKKASKMLQFAKVTDDDIIYDLGSGFGGLVIEAGKKAKKAVGIEYDPIRYIVSKIRAWIINSKARFKRGDLFKENIKDASVVFLFLKQKTNQKLKPKLIQLKKGTKIISNCWTFEKWKPTKLDKKLKVYMYEIGKSN